MVSCPVCPGARRALKVVRPPCLPSSLLNSRFCGPPSPCETIFVEHLFSSKPGRACWHHAGCLLLHSVLIDPSHYSRFGGEETEAQRGEVACPKSHRILIQVFLIPSAMITSRLVRQSPPGWRRGLKWAPGKTEGAESSGTQAEAVSHSLS